MNHTPIDLTDAKVFIVDDQPENLNTLYDTLSHEGYEISTVPSGEIALEMTKRVSPELILLDIVMPGMDGYTVCQKLKENPATAEIPVIFITQRTESADRVKGFEVGGVDYITKPFYAKEVLLRVKTHLGINRLTKGLSEQNTQLEAMNHQLRTEIERRQQAEKAREDAEIARQQAEDALVISQQEAELWRIEGFTSRSQIIGQLIAEVRKLHKLSKTNVLLTGENGTGKEMIACAIHFGGSRRARPFFAVDCSAIHPELAESTLFGHIKGAFTGATANRKGYFELADNGTLFLDEIGNMPLEVQAKLLRVIEAGEILPVGGTKKRVDVQIIAATNADLRAKIAAGTFRQDLYFRLAEFPLEVPPLRERKEDIPLLVEHFLKMFAEKDHTEKPTVSTATLSALSAYPFPGNIRELKNIVRHAMISSGDTTIQPEHLHFIDTTPHPPPKLPKNNDELIAALTEVRRDAAARLVRETLTEWFRPGESIAEVARQHGIPRPRLYQLCQEYDLDLNQLRESVRE